MHTLLHMKQCKMERERGSEKKLRHVLATLLENDDKCIARVMMQQLNCCQMPM